LRKGSSPKAQKMDTSSVTEVAKGITDYGMLAVTAAFFLLISAAGWLGAMKWFKTTINSLIDRNSKMVDDLLTETRAQNDTLADISEGLKPETQLRVKNTANVYFDLATERVCRLVEKVRKENHIVDVEATRAKIKTLAQNIHDDRDSRFDSYTFRGRKLSQYTAAQWVDWVAEVIEKEVYDKAPNQGRTFTNVQAVYERIKLDFYHRLNG
jgi:hypothetical protein